MTQIEELQERLAETERLRVESERKRDEVLAVRDLEARIRDNEIAVRLAEELAKAESEYGPDRVRAVRVGRNNGPGFVIVKAPALPTFRKYQDGGKASTASVMSLITPCRLFPSASEFDEMMDREPAILTEVGDAVCELAGVRIGDAVGK